MPGAFHGIGMASNALRAFQSALDITGHNLANVNTRGYTRQVVEYRNNEPSFSGFGRGFAVGQGVSISSINRVRDQFLDMRMQSAQGDHSRFQTLAATLNQIEPMFREPGTSGISNALDGFFNAWSGAASNPSEAANLMEVQRAGQTLADRIRGTYRDIRARQDQLSTEMQGTIASIDSLTTRIAEMNREIRAQQAVGARPNDLMDQRDVLIEEVSQLVEIQTFPTDSGEITVHFGGFPLVDTAGNHAFPKNINASTFTTSDGSRNFTIRGGALYGQMEAFNAITGYLSSLDTLANELRANVNNLHITGTNGNGTTNINFFNANPAPPQNGAIDFDLSALVKADTQNIALGVSGNEGDGGLALALSNLRSTNIAGLTNRTFSGFLRDTVSGVADDVLSAKNGMETFDAVIAQVENQRQAVVGVSIDDEMANMLKFQRSYQAAARALSVFDQMTEELIGLVR